MFYPAITLVYYCYDDFVIRLYIFKVGWVLSNLSKIMWWLSWFGVKAIGFNVANVSVKGNDYRIHFW